MDIVNIAPENLEIANSYLSTGSAIKTAEQLAITPDKVMDVIEKREVKAYIDGVYLDQGYRNRFRLAELLDEVIEHKIEEARESDVYSTKDLADLISLAHKMSRILNTKITLYSFIRRGCYSNYISYSLS